MSQMVWTELVEAIHDSEHQLVLAVTGGGSKAISQLLDVAGASRTVLEAVVPYSSSALTEWLGGEPEKYCNEPTARAIAMAAWMRARRLASTDVAVNSLLGVGATASLASDRPKRGTHRIHVAVQSAMGTKSYSLQLEKGSRDRKKEQWLAAKLIFLAIGEACRIDSSAAEQALDSQLLADEQINRNQRQAEAGWSDVLLGKKEYAVALPHAMGKDGDGSPPHVIFPGAFNPPHKGHKQMAEIAATRLGQPVAFELSIVNVEKPPLDFIRISERVKTFHNWNPEATLLLTNAPTFRTKSALFPGCTFIVGADTIERIADPKYYDGDQAGRDAAVRAIAEHSCRFLVFGREIEGAFQSLGDSKLPDSLRALCDEVTESEFRSDISSTELRNADHESN